MVGRHAFPSLLSPSLALLQPSIQTKLSQTGISHNYLDIVFVLVLPLLELQMALKPPRVMHTCMQYVKLYPYKLSLPSVFFYHIMVVLSDCQDFVVWLNFELLSRYDANNPFKIQNH